MARAPRPGTTRGGFNTISPNFRYRITTLEGDVYEVRTLPVDHFALSKHNLKSVSEAEGLSSAYPLAWAASKRAKHTEDTYEAWLETVENIELYNDEGEEDESPKG